MISNDPVKGVLLDMDGVVHVGANVLPGARKAIEYLNAHAIPYRFLTNTTTKSPLQLAEMLTGMGLPVTVDEIITTHQVAANHLRKTPERRCYLLVRDNVLPLYKGLTLSESHPDTIVIGDIGDRWNYTLMSELFSLVMLGADVVALHKGRYWKARDGLKLDIGAFITGLEYATGKDATVVGKPSAAFFETGVEDLGLKKENVVMIGDDIESDIRGAHGAGLKAVLVKTGKYRATDVTRSGVQPDAVIENVSEIDTLF